MSANQTPPDESKIDRGIEAGADVADAAASTCFVVDLFDDVCYVATAAHGDLDAPEVVLLRRYRDARLRPRRLGRLFIAVYYTIGPVAAAGITAVPVLRRAARRALAPAVWWARRQVGR